MSIVVQPVEPPEDGPVETEAPARRISPRTATILAGSLIIALGLLIGSAIALQPKGDLAGKAKDPNADELQAGGADQVEGAGDAADSPVVGGSVVTTAPGRNVVGPGATSSTRPGTPASIAPVNPDAGATGTTTTTTLTVVGATTTTASTVVGAPRTSTTQGPTTTRPPTPPASTTTTMAPPKPGSRTVVDTRHERIAVADNNSQFRRYSFGPSATPPTAAIVPGSLSISVSFKADGSRKISTRIYNGGQSPSYADIIADCPAGSTSPQTCAATASASQSSYTFVLQGEDLGGQAVDIDVTMRYDVAA